MATTQKPLVLVIWHDARDADGTWTPEADLDEFNEDIQEVRSVGYLVREGPKYLTLAADSASDGDYGRICKIPTGMVVSKVELVHATPAPPA